MFSTPFGKLIYGSFNKLSKELKNGIEILIGPLVFKFSNLIPDPTTDKIAYQVLKGKKKNDRVLCFAFEVFCLVNSFMMLKKKKKVVVARLDPRTLWLWNPRLTAKLFISNMASRTIRPSTYAIPKFKIWFKKKKTLSNKNKHGECLKITILWI